MDNFSSVKNNKPSVMSAQFLFGDNADNQNYILLVLLEMTFLDFREVKWLQLTGEMGNFRHNFSKIKRWTDILGHCVGIHII